MKQLFEYHIDKKELTPLLSERSLKIYIQNFDPNYAYLLKSEASRYLAPEGALLERMGHEYRDRSFKTYFALNGLICKTIERARMWRATWRERPLELIVEAKRAKREGFEAEEHPSSLQDLEKRHYRQYLLLIALYLEGQSEQAIKGNEAKVVSLCEKQLRVLENQYLGLDDPHSEFAAPAVYQHYVILRTLKALAHSLDAHTAYYSPEEAFAMRVQLEKGMCGIGVVLREGIEGFLIAEIVKGGPADQVGGLKVGDTIVEIDGASTQEFSFQKVLEVLRGTEGSKMVLGVKRRIATEKQEFVRIELQRAKIVLEDKRVDISHEPCEGGIIGKITLYSFYEGEGGISSERDVRMAIEQLREKGPLLGLVLDMRENSGGFLSQAVRVSGLFIRSGVVVISKYSDGSTKLYRSIEGSTFYDGPLVILVSKGSASATEIVAQTLQDYGVAVIVGDERTYGKGTIQHQTVTSQKSDAFFKVTIGRYYTVSGRSTQIDGVRSDIIVPTAYYYEKMGEEHLDYPLPQDQIESAFEDPLTDVDPFARKWFVKYYLPVLQRPQTVWQDHLEALKENSRVRLERNRAFQNFLRQAQQKEGEGRSRRQERDLQMEESVQIVRDMILLEAPVGAF